MWFGKCVIKSDVLLILKRSIILWGHNFFIYKMEALVLILLRVTCIKA